MKLLMAVNAENERLAAHSTHYLLPHQFPIHISHFPNMVYFHIPSDLTAVFASIGAESADEFSPAHGEPFRAGGHIHSDVDQVGGTMVASRNNLNVATVSSFPDMLLILECYNSLQAVSLRRT